VASSSKAGERETHPVEGRTFKMVPKGEKSVKKAKSRFRGGGGSKGKGKGLRSQQKKNGRQTSSK